MKIIVCRTAEAVRHTFFYCKSKNVSYLCHCLTKNTKRYIYLFLSDVYIPRKIDVCPVYGGFLRGNLADNIRQ